MNLHHKKQTRTFYKRANVDLSNELLVEGLEGEFIELYNARMTSANGEKGAVEKINGEVSLYPAVDTSCNATYGGAALPSLFENMASEEINGRIVEVWANANPVIPPFIRIDGVIVASHPDLPFRVDYPIQVDKNENCPGGELFSTDDRVPPIILNIKDMLVNSGITVGDTVGVCTEKYFSDFNIDKYTINLRIQVDQMRFVRIAQNNPSEFNVVYGSTGLLGGSYQYTYNYVTADGDRSALAPVTPTIPVPRVLNAQSQAYPYSRTFGSAIGDLETTNGVHLRFRVTNTQGYAYIEIIRIPYNADLGLGYTPTPEIIGQYPLDPSRPYEVVNILDYGAEGVVLDEIQQSNMMSAIAHCKSLRYFDGKLNLFNITYASRDTIDSVEFKQINGENAVPVTAHLAKAGHADPWNSTYRKSLQHDEYYGWALVLWDAYGNYTFAQDVPGFENFKMPQNREPQSQDSVDNAYGQTPMQMSDMNGSTSICYEYWDTHDLRAKENACDEKTIIGCPHDEGTIGEQNVWAYTEILLPIAGTAFFNLVPGGLNDIPAEYDCDSLPNDNTNSLFNMSGGPPPIINAFMGEYRHGDTIGYHILHPINEYDTSTSVENDLDYVPNVRVVHECYDDCYDGFGYVDDCYETYKPEGFGIDWFALGMAFGGLTSWPTWATGFGIVRTQPSGRVVAEGMGFYDIEPNDFNTVGQDIGATKDQYGIMGYFPDIENGMVQGDLISQIQANPSNYAMQLFAPVGFFAELYHFHKDVQVERDQNIDMILYPRIQYDNGSINPLETCGHVEFGKWRGDSHSGYASANPTPGDVTDGDTLYEFPMDNVAITGVTHPGRGISIGSGTSYYLFNFPNSVRGIYNNVSSNAHGTCNKHFVDQDVKNWHEPLYQIRIVRKGISINTTQNIKEFVDVGHWQKFESIIGQGDGSLTQSFVLVDERWEDCCPDISNSGFYAGRDAFVYLVNPDTLDEQKWLNATYINVIDRAALLADIAANGFAEHNGVEIHGLYKHSGTSDGREVTLIFDSIPVPPGFNVVVRYDNTIPIRLFAGEKFVGEDIFCPVDEQVTANPTDTNTFSLNIGFPFYRYQVNPRMILSKRTYNTFPPISSFANETMQEWTLCNLDYIRQIAVMFPVLCRSHLGYPHERRNIAEGVAREGFFPATHYIMRGNRMAPGGESGVPIFTIYGATEIDNWCDSGGSYPGHVYPQYRDDYPNEAPYVDGAGIMMWKFGGFRYEKLINYNYSQTGSFRKYYSRPLVGFVEQTKFCTRLIWSLTRIINVQDDPGLRTFYVTNAYDFDDRQGEGKKLWSATSSKGMNLYGFMDSGIVLMITDKRIISDLNAEELMLAGTGDEGYIGGEYWLSKKVGMTDELYRASADRDNVIFFPDNESMWMFANDSLVDIGRLGYHYRVRRNYLEQILPEYRTRIMAIYSPLNNEVWFGIRGNCVEISLEDANQSLNYYYPAPQSVPYNVTIVVSGSDRPGDGAIELPDDSGFPIDDRICIFNNTDDPITAYYPVGLIVQQFVIDPGEQFCFTRSSETGYAAYTATQTDPGCQTELLVYAPKNEGWVGRYAYSFDKYLSVGNRMFGFRDATTYELNLGTEINGAPIDCYAETVFNPEPNDDKEFTRIRIASDHKPTSVEFIEELDAVPVATMSAAVHGPFYLKDYRGWEHLIPRKSVSPYGRIQGRNILVRVRHSDEGPFVMSSVRVEYKTLK